MPITIAFGHATGFCGGVWNPVLKELDSMLPEESMQLLAWDFPNHGASPRWPFPVDWWDFGRWAGDLVQDRRGGPVVGVGHSMGGAALTMAEILYPGTFAALLLIEPMLFPPPYVRSPNHLSEAVLKRRRSFASKEEARENFASKSPFDTWHSLALEGYLDSGLVQTPEGTFALACSPEAESDVYEGATVHGAWERLSEVAAPVLILAGSDSGSYSSERARATAERFQRAGVETVAGENHFLPMENPRLLAARIERISSAFERQNRAGRAKP